MAVETIHFCLVISNLLKATVKGPEGFKHRFILIYLSGCVQILNRRVHRVDVHDEANNFTVRIHKVFCQQRHLSVLYVETIENVNENVLVSVLAFLDPLWSHLAIMFPV